MHSFSHIFTITILNVFIILFDHHSKYITHIKHIKFKLNQNYTNHISIFMIKQLYMYKSQIIHNMYQIRVRSLNKYANTN